MNSILTSLVTLMSMSPVVYLGGVAFTASAFTMMKNLVDEYKDASEWPYIIIILINGIVPTFISASDASFLASINPAYIILITPAMAIIEFAILSRDSIRTYLIFAGIIMLQFACLFGVGAAIITASEIPTDIATTGTIQAASITFSLFLLAISLAFYAYLSSSYAQIMKKLIHDLSSGTSIFVYMMMNGLILGIAVGFDYPIYFSSSDINPYRDGIIIGMLLRYALILVTSWLLILVICKIEANRIKMDQFEQASLTDPLTGLLNRAGLEQRVGAIYRNREPSDIRATFFMLDLDHFKEVNDNLGHPVGDELLIRVARTLENAFRESDIICRLGGDEFCIFCNGMEDEGLILKKAELLNKTLRFYYALENGSEINTSTSIGIAVLPENGPDFDTLYTNADQALYTSKENGRDCFVIADRS